MKNADTSSNGYARCHSFFFNWKERRAYKRRRGKLKVYEKVWLSYTIIKITNKLEAFSISVTNNP